MKIVGIAACTSGIAHTYIAKEKLMSAAKELGHEAHIETQGTIGTEDNLLQRTLKMRTLLSLRRTSRLAEKNVSKAKKLWKFPLTLQLNLPRHC